jgi:iron complex outermembrane receptor protein
MTTRLHFFGGPLADGLAYYGLPKFVNTDTKLRRENLVYWETDSSGSSYSYTQARRPQEIENFSQPHYELIHEWRISRAVSFNNTIFYYTGDGFFDYDASWADTSMLRIGYSYGIPASQNPANTLVRAFVGNRQGGWLPRVEINHGSGNLTLGAELRIHRSVHWGKIQFAEGLPQNFDPDYHFYEYNGEKDVLSIYVHELYRLSDRWSLMTDLQLVHNRYGIENEKYLANNFSLPYFFANPRAGINWNATDEWNSYLSLAFTTREPRLRNLYAAEDSYFGALPLFYDLPIGVALRYDFTRPLAQPEQLLDVELGAAFKNSDARLSANVYWMEFTNELVENGRVDIFGQPVTGNAERTRHVGVELDGIVSLYQGLSLAGNVSLSSNKLVNHLTYLTGYDTAGNQIVTATSLNDNPIAGFPGVLGNIRLTYRTDRLTASIACKYVGSYYTDNFKNEQNKNDAYSVFDAQLLYRLQRTLGTEVNLRGEVRNVFNNLYFAHGIGSGFFPAAERNYLFGLTVIL